MMIGKTLEIHPHPHQTAKNESLPSESFKTKLNFCKLNTKCEWWVKIDLIEYEQFSDFPDINTEYLVMWDPNSVLFLVSSV